MPNLTKYSLKKESTYFKVEKITSLEKSATIIKKFYSDDIEVYESLFILLLNNSNQTIGYAKISQGGIVGTVVDVRLILKYAIDSLATSVIMAHNHPTGNLKASPQDINITRKVSEALKMFDVTLLDSIIVTKDSYSSFINEI